MSETLNTLTLGVDLASARTFRVRGPVNEGPISDFAAQVRLGEPTYDARQGAGYVVFDTLHGGGGILEGKVREDLGRWAWNTGVYTGVQGIATRALLTQQGTVPAFSGGWAGRGVLRALQVQLMAGSLPAWHTLRALGNKLIEINGPGLGWTDVTPGGTVAFYPPTSFIPSTGGSAGSPMVVVCNASTVWTETSLVGPAWATTISLPGGTTPRGVLGYGDLVLILLNDGRVIYSTDGANFVTDSGGSNADVVWYLPGGAAEWLGVFRAPWGDAAPYIIWGGTIWVGHFHARKFFPLPTPLTNIMAFAPFEDGFVITNGHTVLQIILSGDQSLVREMPIFPAQGAPPGENWQVAALSESSDGRLYAQLTKGDLGWIWEWNGIGWHPYGVSVTIGARAEGLASRDRAAPFSRPIDQQNFIWQFGTNGAWQVRGPTNARNPLTDTSYTYDTTPVYMETPWWDMGFNELRGALFEIWYGGILPTGGSILVGYALDGAASFTTLGVITTSTDPPRLRWSTPDADGAIAGTEFRRIKFRWAPQHSGGVSPNLLPMTVVYRKKPLQRMGFTATIDAAHMISHPEDLTGWGGSITMEQIMDYLRTLWSNQPQLYFKFADRTPTRVNLITYTGIHQEIRSTVRRGRIPIQLEEAVDGS